MEEVEEVEEAVEVVAVVAVEEVVEEEAAVAVGVEQAVADLLRADQHEWQEEGGEREHREGECEQRDKVLPVRGAQVRQALAVAAPLREVRVPVVCPTRQASASATALAKAGGATAAPPVGPEHPRAGGYAKWAGQPGAGSARVYEAPELALSTRWPCWPGPDSAFLSSLPRPQLKLKPPPLFSGAISRAVGVFGRPPPKDAGSELSMVGPPRRQRWSASSDGAGGDRAAGLGTPRRARAHTARRRTAGGN